MVAPALVLFLLLAAPAVAQQAAAEADPFAGPVCHDRATFDRAVAAKGGQVFLQLDGASIRDTGRDVAVDTGETFYSYVLAGYPHGDAFRWTLVRGTEPANRNPTRLCAVAGGNAVGRFADVRPGQPGIDNTFGDFPAGSALNHCRAIRPVVDRLLDDRLQRVGDSVMTSLEYLEALARVLGNDLGERRRRRQGELRAVEATGDALCNRLEPLLAIHRDNSNCRLIGQVVGEEFVTDGTRHKMAFSFLFCRDAPYRRSAAPDATPAPGVEPWRILKTFESGATFPWADGATARANVEYLARLAAGR